MVQFSGATIENPGEWKYSSFNFYAFNVQSTLIIPNPEFLGLSIDEERRRKAYRKYVEETRPSEYEKLLEEKLLVGMRTTREKITKLKQPVPLVPGTERG